MYHELSSRKHINGPPLSPCKRVTINLQYCLVESVDHFAQHIFIIYAILETFKFYN